MDILQRPHSSIKWGARRCSGYLLVTYGHAPPGRSWSSPFPIDTVGTILGGPYCSILGYGTENGTASPPNKSQRQTSYHGDRKLRSKDPD